MIGTNNILLSSTAVLTAHVLSIKRLAKKRGRTRVSSRKGRPTRPRTRKSVRQVFNELGRKMFRRAYRMHIETFFALYQKIKRMLHRVMAYNSSRLYAPNGRIHPTIRLACALRFFAGGDPLDIMTSYGISKTEVHNSIDYIIQAVNDCGDMDILFPTDHEEQKKIAEGFKALSDADIDNCVGPTDGMLVWVSKPSAKECKKSGVGSKKFFCGRKHKFGLNLQAICDHKKRFTYISIKFPGATSDFLAFEATPLRIMLETPGFLAPGLCLFGDNAYVNRFYIATPFPNVKGDNPKDHYNFYHSQVRINIECAFGILVHRWGVLRKPTPIHFTNKKVTALVLALCKLHNFLIDARLEPQNDHPTTNTAEDRLNFDLNGGIPMQSREIAELGGRRVALPEQILGGGEHFDDCPDRARRQRETQRNLDLPRELLLRKIIEGDFRRPVIRK